MTELCKLRIGGVMASGGMGKTTLFREKANLFFNKPYETSSGVANRVAIVTNDYIFWPADYELEGFKLADCMNPATLAFVLGDQISLSYAIWNCEWGMTSDHGEQYFHSPAELADFLSERRHIYITHSFFPRTGAGIVAAVSPEFHYERLQKLQSPHWLMDAEKEQTRKAVLSYHDFLRREILDNGAPGIIIDEEELFLTQLFDDGTLELLADALVYHEQSLFMSSWIV